MSDESGRTSPPDLDALVEARTDAAEDWRWLWEGDHAFPVQSHRGFRGALVVWLKKLLRPWVRAPQADLWERQRAFNLVLVRSLERVASLQRQADELHRDLTEVRADLLKDIQAHHERLAHLEEFKRHGLGDFARHSEGLFTHVDQKLDRYRRESLELARALQELPGNRGD